MVYQNAEEMKRLTTQNLSQEVNHQTPMTRAEILKKALQASTQPAGTANDNFARGAYTASVDVAQARKLSELEYTILQGKHINAVLETPINSNLPGQIKAVVSNDVYGEKGNIVLVPKGSRLIGTYNSATAQGQVRVYVVWTRIITPAHVEIMVNSAGADDLGLAGLEGHVNNHFFKRFGSAILMSLIGGAAQTIGVGPQDQQNSLSTQRDNVGQQINQMSSVELSKTMNIPPTISLPQGAQVTVMVQRDLKFDNVKSAYQEQ